MVNSGYLQAYKINVLIINVLTDIVIIAFFVLDPYEGKLVYKITCCNIPTP